MKVILFKNVIHRGKRYGVGETLDLDEAVAEHFIKRELAHYAAPETADASIQGEGENLGADENGEQGENLGADNQDAGEDKAPADTVKPETPAIKAEKQTKGKGKAAKK